MSLRFYPITFLTGLLLLAHSTATAQLPGGDGSPGVSTAMLKLFGANTAFTARADVQVVDGGKAEQLRTPMTFAALDGRLRVEIDMAQIRGKELSPAAVASLKPLGLDRVVSLLRPDRKALFIVYPNAQSYVNLPMNQAEIAADKNLRLEKTALARETVDGHPCVKNQVVIKSGTNLVLTATTWNASDLKDFPVQIATREKDMTSIMRFDQIQFVRPDAKQFDPPAGFKVFTDAQSLVLARSAKVPKGTSGSKK